MTPVWTVEFVSHEFAPVLPEKCQVNTGVYGFELTGNATISASPQPVVSVGRLVFDGVGGISGVASVSFTGLYLGNPVTGKYEAHDDCSVSVVRGHLREHRSAPGERGSLARISRAPAQCKACRA